MISSTRWCIERRFTSSRTSRMSSKGAPRNATASGITKSEQCRRSSDNHFAAERQDMVQPRCRQKSKRPTAEQSRAPKPGFLHGDMNVEDLTLKSLGLIVFAHLALNPGIGAGLRKHLSHKGSFVLIFDLMPAELDIEIGRAHV